MGRMFESVLDMVNSISPEIGKSLKEQIDKRHLVKNLIAKCIFQNVDYSELSGLYDKDLTVDIIDKYSKLLNIYIGVCYSPVSNTIPTVMIIDS